MSQAVNHRKFIADLCPALSIQAIIEISLVAVKIKINL